MMLTDYDPTLSIRGNAEKYGISRRQAKKRKDAHENGLPDSHIDRLLRSKGIDPGSVEILKEGISERDPFTGSWTKVVYKAVTGPEEDPYEAVDAAALLNALDRAEGSPEAGDGVFGISINDTQLGKSENGGTEGTVLRVKASVQKAKARVAELRKINRKLGTLLIVGGGDIIEGCTIYPNQPFGIDLHRHQQIETAVTLLLWVIDQMASDFDRVVVLATKGNHGENRINGNKTSPGDNDDTLVWKMARFATERDSALSHVEYIIAEGGEESVCVDLAGWRIATTHGDIFGKFVQGQTKMKKAQNWYKNMAAGRFPVGSADVLITHHFHHDEMADWGACLWRQTRAQDGGSAYFEQFSGEYSQPGMLTWVTTPENRWQDEATF